MKTNLIGISGKIGSGKDTVGIILQGLSEGASVNNIKYIIENSFYNPPPGAYQIKKFANKLKDIVCLLIGCTREQLEDREFKEKELGEEWWVYAAYQHGISSDILKSIHAKREDAEYIFKYSHMNSVRLIKLTPRKLLQLLGTECGRQIIHPNIWVNALFADYKWDGKSLTEGWYPTYSNPDNSGGDLEAEPLMPNWIITDVRFPNEAKAIKDRGGIVIRVNRTPRIIKHSENISYEFNPVFDKEHPSETSLDNYEFDHVIDNNGSIEELVEKVKQLKLV